MISREKVWEVLEDYDLSKVKIGVVGSHSGLDVADGAVEEGFESKVYCQRGREKTYSWFMKSRRGKTGKIERGCVDGYEVFTKFKEMEDGRVQKSMRDENILFVPNRSFTSYLDINAVEEYQVPFVGSRNMLRTEERGEGQDYYWLLEKAGLPFPEKVKDPQDIDGLCIVKLHHARKKLERGFFTAASVSEYEQRAEQLITQGVITSEDLQNARIEKYIIGPVFNLDFFYNPLEEELSKIELLGVDWRFETSLDGHVRLPAPQQMSMVGGAQEIPEYTVCGHNSATLRESLLERAFELSEKFVEASVKHYNPGIIGAFCLQTCVDKDLNFYIYDVAPRIGGGTNVHMNVGHAYGNSLWHTNMSTGRRTAKLVREAVEQERVDEIVT